MIVRELIEPKSIVVIGASNDVEKPGGKLLLNLLSGGFKGTIYAVNPKESIVQGIECFKDVSMLPQTDLAVIAVAAKYIPDAVEILTSQKNTKAFIILSAGFSETGEEGRLLERKIVEIIDAAGASLIGPNCIGVLNTNYKAVFAGPIPVLDPKGCDCVSGSGATMCFILEAAIPKGLTFSSVFSVGNSAQIGVEDVLEYWDENFDPETSSRIKLIYIEKIDNAQKLLKHSASLINKGCRIAAIKSGTSEAGSRAVSSHTGALAGSDAAVDALFKKAGIVRCYNRNELIDVATVFTYKEMKGDNLAIITHAGGPGVMLTDTLSNENINVPGLNGPIADELLTKLFPGSSVANPIDFLATGTADQLRTILEYTDKKFENIDASAVIFGTTGLFNVKDVYKVIDEAITNSVKPVYPVMPSIVLAGEEMEYFKSLGRAYFTDESALGKALGKIRNTAKPSMKSELPEIDIAAIREIIDSSDNSYLSPDKNSALLTAAGILHAKEKSVYSLDEALSAAESLSFPLVMKVIGPVHKSDVGGVALNLTELSQIKDEFERMMKIPDAEGVLLQQMLSGTELYAGAKREKNFGHLILCGLGGIFIEVLKDISVALSPVSVNEAEQMIKSLKSYKIIQGVRGKSGVNEEHFIETLVRLSALLEAAPEIAEMDLNPLLGNSKNVIAVDCRIRIEK